MCDGHTLGSLLSSEHNVDQVDERRSRLRGTQLQNVIDSDGSELSGHLTRLLHATAVHDRSENLQIHKIIRCLEIRRNVAERKIVYGRSF